MRRLVQRDPGFTRENTLVIATGSSNGGGAVLYAAERDAATGAHLIDAAVAREPQVQLKPDDRVVVVRGLVERRGSERTLLDYFTFGNLYQPCAALAVPDIPLRDRIGFAPNRCASLHDKGLLDADTLEGQAKESLDRMHACGWDADTDVGHAFGYFVAPDATATKYANDHGRFDVRDRLCGYSYAAVDKDGLTASRPSSCTAATTTAFRSASRRVRMSGRTTFRSGRARSSATSRSPTPSTSEPTCRASTRP